MRNNINILKDIDSSVFLNKIKIYLGNNLSNQLITSLSNMLAIDYVNRLKQEPKMDEYAMECVDRLTTHLNHKVFTDEVCITTTVRTTIQPRTGRNLVGFSPDTSSEVVARQLFF